MLYAIIDGGTVYNIAVSESALSDNWVQCDESVAVGDIYDVETDTFAKTEPSLTEAKARKRAAIASGMQTHFLAGFAYDFGAISTTEEDGTTADAGVRQLQLRDTWDRSNWSNMLSAAQEQIDAGNGSQAADSPIRTADNARVHVTNQQARDALVALRNWGSAVLAHSWDLKDQVAQASSQSDLDAIDIESGWPS